MRRGLDDGPTVVRVGTLAGGRVHDDCARADERRGPVELEEDPTDGTLDVAAVGPVGVVDDLLFQGPIILLLLLLLFLLLVFIVVLAVAAASEAGTAVPNALYPEHDLPRLLLPALPVDSLDPVLPPRARELLEAVDRYGELVVRHLGHGEHGGLLAVPVREGEVDRVNLALGRLGWQDFGREGLLVPDEGALRGLNVVHPGQALLLGARVVVVIVVVLAGVPCDGPATLTWRLGTPLQGSAFFFNREVRLVIGLKFNFEF